MRSVRHITDTRSTFGELFCDFDAVEGPEVPISLRLYLNNEIFWAPTDVFPLGFCWATSIDPTVSCLEVPECFTSEPSTIFEVPEPALWLALLCGIILLKFLRRRPIRPT